MRITNRVPVTEKIHLSGRVRVAGVVLVIVAAAMVMMNPCSAFAVDAAEINRDVAAALDALYDTTPVAKELGPKAKAILVFPNVVKAGFIGAVSYGEGALLVNGRTAGYYNFSAGSYGYQAGVQSFGYAMFLMTDAAVSYLKKSKGWELGSGPSIVIVDAGKAKSLTTSTLQDDIYGFTFGQKGLMAGIGLQGSKITRIKP